MLRNLGRSAQPQRELKLNLGSGQRPLPGYINVDKWGEPDLRCDLETFPWPWPEDSVAEVRMIHVLEHLGGSPLVFLKIMGELYRVCRHEAKVHITVPHPRHDVFISDPTHVRAITADTMTLFSRRLNLEWQSAGRPNTPLALFHRVDFEIEESTDVLDDPYATDFRDGRIDDAEVRRLLRENNNVAAEIQMRLRVVKS
ncbi:MAG: hypothetical protein EXR27_03835 [Betaproteobacteria bacterium]|nr:hypothetical protein [Betaproteobacteria bacterium]